MDSQELKVQTIVDYMKSLLAKEGVKDYEDAVPDMLVEFFYRFVEDTLQCAQNAYPNMNPNAPMQLNSQVIYNALNTVELSFCSSQQATQFEVKGLNSKQIPEPDDDIFKFQQFNELNFHPPSYPKK